MNHLPVLPVLLPMFAGAWLAMTTGGGRGSHRLLSLMATLLQIPLAAALIYRAGGGISVYALGNWPPPFGIVLVVDRLAALMLLTTAVLAVAALLYALRGDDEEGKSFHTLFQFQLMGINGAFLTGDLFNLFVCFEILLIASYGLLLHGSDRLRTRAGLSYVVLNITGSALFLIALGIFYGGAGTINMADLAVRIAGVPPPDAPLFGAAGALLWTAFGLKAAAFPLHFWLPRAYAAAAAPAAALFAVMTKVGIYAILRVDTLIFNRGAGVLAMFAHDWLWAAALITITLGAVGALAARNIGALVAYLVLSSVGVLLAAVVLGSREALVAGLYYLIHSTWISGALFLLAGVIARARGPAVAGLLIPGPPLGRPWFLSGLFFAGAVAVAGMPPFSGFLGKALLLAAAGDGPPALGLYTAVLGGGLLILIALSRAGSTLFWRQTETAAPGGTPDPVRLGAAVLLLAAAPILVIGAGPILAYLDGAAGQLLSPAVYIAEVLPHLTAPSGGSP
ncbi:MAG TPA: monovalent cation/H+ antiporter subunit D [Syntrophales bacterium]|nr:monovalent cation/H+ antiporter subunit D [Syntrophales bacterium]